MQPLFITGHYGIGDNLFQRAIIREVEKSQPLETVWLHTCHYNLYHDFAERGLNLVIKETKLRAQRRTLERERKLFKPRPMPKNIICRQISYPPHLIQQHGSILGAMFANVKIKMPEMPDFRLPIKPEWRKAARALIDTWDRKGKPLLIFRPAVVRREWMPTAHRNPEIGAFNRIFARIRKEFFVVSIADLQLGIEWIEGGERINFDVKFHFGELDFPTMAALWAEADLIYTPSGFGFVLAQAVGTPSITVFGGRESSRTALTSGMHLAPSLGIDPDNPCDCHTTRHQCNKRITLEPALKKVEQFLEALNLRDNLYQRRFQGEASAALAELSPETKPRLLNPVGGLSLAGQV